jgi:hypothetical protein
MMKAAAGAGLQMPEGQSNVVSVSPSLQLALLHQN